MFIEDIAVLAKESRAMLDKAGNGRLADYPSRAAAGNVAGILVSNAREPGAGKAVKIAIESSGDAPRSSVDRE